MEYIDFPLEDGSTYSVTFKEAEFYETNFPQLNVAQEFCKMLVWLDANPRRRKTRRGTKSFISGWLNRAQDKIDAASSRVRMEARIGAH